jgi:hypothetical protein
MSNQETKLIYAEALEIAAQKMLDVIKELRLLGLDDKEAVAKYKKFWSLML